MITISGHSFGTNPFPASPLSVQFGTTLAQATMYISDSSLIATPSAGKAGVVNISLIRGTVNSLANIPFEYILDLNYGTMFLTSNIAGSSTVFSFVHIFTSGLRNSSDIDFTFPKQFVFSVNSTISCNISGIMYSEAIYEWRTNLKILQPFEEFATMKCVGSEVVLVGYETSLDSTIMLVHLDHLEIVFQSFEPSLSRTIASPITLSLIGSALLKAGSTVDVSTILTFQQHVSNSSTFFVELISNFIDGTASVEFVGTSKKLSKQQNIASFFITLSLNLSLSMSFKNLTLPGQSGEVVFVSGFIIDAGGRKTHQLIHSAISVEINEFVKTTAICSPGCFTGESFPSRIEIITANDLMEGSFLQVHLIGNARIQFQLLWTTDQNNSSGQLINSSTFKISFGSQISKKSFISLQTKILSIKTGPSDIQHFSVCTYSKSEIAIDCSTSYFTLLPSRISLFFSSKTFALGTLTSLNIGLFQYNALPPSLFCNITFNDKTSIQQVHIQTKTSQIHVESWATRDRVVTI